MNNKQILIERPLDFLNEMKGKKVIVRCKAYKEYDLEGILHAFDIHINLVLDCEEDKKKVLRFVRGDNVLFVEESA